MTIKKRKTHTVHVGSIDIGHTSPIRIQSMTNTLTANVDQTVSQIIELANTGSELVRLSVKDDADASAIPEIKNKLAKHNISVPLIGDFHYNGHLLLTNHPECAENLDKYRINPGNVGFETSHDKNFQTFIDCALRYNKPIRIGANSGSIDPTIYNKLIAENSQKPKMEIALDSLLISVIESAKLAEKMGLPSDRIILSIKTTHVPDLLYIYRALATKTVYPLHLGLTEAGVGLTGIIASASGLSILLNEGIGDTIRVSVTPTKNAKRSDEVTLCKHILQSLHIRYFSPTVISCPGCGRTSSTLYQSLAEDITNYLEKKSIEWKTKNFNGFEQLVVAVMGCIVNGPGESKHANIGISLPGHGEDPHCPVFIDGHHTTTLHGNAISDEFKSIIDDYVEKHYRT